MKLLMIPQQSNLNEAGIENGTKGQSSTHSLYTKQIAPNLMYNYGTKTQQSAEIRNGVQGLSSMCSLHMEQIAQNSVCNNGTETQQSAVIRLERDNDEDSTISRDIKED
eukprot:11559206-Ditylum_brightwellii.AAC.1